MARALQGLVIGMGVLIVVGFAAVIWGLFTINRPAGEGEAAVALGELSLGLPAGCTIAGMALSGERLAVRTAGPAAAAGAAGCGRIFIVDLARGAVVGTVAR